MSSHIVSTVAVPQPFHIRPEFTYPDSNWCRPEASRAGCSTGQYSKNALIYAQGERSDSVFVILGGWVKLCAVSPQGRQAVMAVMGAGSILGEYCLLDQPYQTASATAIEKSTIFRIQKHDLRQRLLREAPFADSFMRRLLEQKERTERALLTQLFHSSEKRLASTLLYLAPSGSDRIPRMNQETLAAMVGTTRSRISYFMNKLKRDGLVRYDNGIRLDRQRLTELLEE